MTRPDIPRYTVAHIGALDLASYGDQLYPLVAAAELGRRLDDVEVLPFGPVGVVDQPGGHGEPEAGTWALGHWSDERATRLASQSTLVLCGGGEIVHGDSTLYTSFYGIDRRDAAALSIDRWFVEGLGGAERTCPVVWHAPGVPVYLDPATTQRVRQAVEHRALVAVRDEHSRHLLEAAGVECPIDVIPDSALLMSRVLEPQALDGVRARLRAVGLLPAEGPVIVVQGNDTMTPLARGLAKALDALAPEPDIVTVSVSPCHGDQHFAEELRAHTTRPTWDLPTTATLEEVAATIAGADCFLGVSLHGAITALAYDRPWVTYDPFSQAKLAGFVELVGVPERRTADPAEAAKLVAQLVTGARPAARVTQLRRTLDDYFDRIADLVTKHDRPLTPVTWTDSAAALHLGLRRLPRPVAPAPTTRPPALRRPAVEPTVDELAAAVTRALEARRAHSLSDPDDHEEVLRLRGQQRDLRGAIEHLEGVAAQAERAAANLADCVEARRALEEVLTQARTSRIFRLTGRPRALGLID